MLQERYCKAWMFSSSSSLGSDWKETLSWIALNTQESHPCSCWFCKEIQVNDLLNAKKTAWDVSLPLMSQVTSKKETRSPISQKVKEINVELTYDYRYLCF
ncbi:hypothetical protein TNIN_208991 [Trichonephila inaurata madagascariensis]|uniref:Uncharacterized protein n=1 Tax=Trichonephila inaurata madagascariensis TaxID=2747483 RepID=A0A8X6XHF4_9ARAC|nr:hypothetical protein TNIN_208991 [Trichonephila inaurata madagascariensis]